MRRTNKVLVPVFCLTLLSSSYGCAMTTKNVIGEVVVPYIQSLDASTELGVLAEELAVVEAELAAANADINQASLLLSGTSIPDASQIDSLVAQLLSAPAHSGSNPPPPLVNQISVGLNPYLANTLANLVAVFGETGQVVQVAAGDNHALVLFDTGTIYGVGDNSVGQLGIGTTTSKNALTPMNLCPLGSDLPNFIFAGGNCSFVLTAAGKIYGCGDNSTGQLGLGSTASPKTSLTPMILTPIGADVPVKISTKGTHTLILTDNQNVFGCGNNSFGELGQGDFVSPKTTLVQIVNGYSFPFDDIAAGKNFSLFSEISPGFWSCGKNDVGQLGINDVGNQNIPTLIADLSLGSQGIVCAGNDFCMVPVNQDFVPGSPIRAWGNNSSGQLGLGSLVSPQWLPASVDVTSLFPANPVQFSAGADFALVLADNNQLYGCGNNSKGQLGLGNTAGPHTVLTSVNLAPLGGALPPNPLDVDFVASGSFMLISTTDGKVYGAGDNSHYQLGIGAVAASQSTLTKMHYNWTPVVELGITTY